MTIEKNTNIFGVTANNGHFGSYSGADSFDSTPGKESALFSHDPRLFKKDFLWAFILP